MHDLFHGRHARPREEEGQAFSIEPGEDDALLTKPRGMHELFHGRHHVPVSMRHTAKRKPRQDPLSRLSEGMHELFHGKHTAPVPASFLRATQADRPSQHEQARLPPNATQEVELGEELSVQEPWMAQAAKQRQQQEAQEAARTQKQQEERQRQDDAQQVQREAEQAAEVARREKEDATSPSPPSFPEWYPPDPHPPKEDGEVKPSLSPSPLPSPATEQLDSEADILADALDQSSGELRPAEDATLRDGDSQANEAKAEDADAMQRERGELAEAERRKTEAAERGREEEGAENQSETEEAAKAEPQARLEAEDEARQVTAGNAEAEAERREIEEVQRREEEEAARAQKEQDQAAEAARQQANPWPDNKTPLALRARGAITLVVLSDRVLPIQTAVGSVLMRTDVALDIWIIGDNVTGLEEKLRNSLPLKSHQNIQIMSMDDAEATVVDLEPPWMSEESGRSIGNESWRSEHTVLQKDWDHDPMHHSRFNIMRFYLPHLTPFKDVDQVLFMDDDVILTDDISLLAHTDVPDDVVVVGQCDNFAWQNECRRYAPFMHGHDWTFNSATLYLQRDATSVEHGHCPYSDPTLCGPSVEEHENFLKRLYAEKNGGQEIDFAAQPVWNFGLVRFNLAAWREQGLTASFKWWLAKNEEHRIFPEDSLGYGLGLPYLSFAGHVRCWNDFISKPARDGLGYITTADFKAQGIDLPRYLNESIYLHYSGRKKPWRLPDEQGQAMMVEQELAAPWLDVLAKLELPEARHFFKMRAKKKTRLKALLVTEPRSGSEWMMDLLDAHPDICASGEREYPTNGFARESLIPGRWDLGIGDCALKRGCMWSFVAENVPKYVSNHEEWCSAEARATGSGTEKALASGLVSNSLHATHGERLCLWASWWKQTYADSDPFRGTNATQRLFDMYERSIFDDASELIPCSCSGQQTMLVKVMRGWAQQRRVPQNEVCSTGTGTHFGSEVCAAPRSEFYTGNYEEHVDVMHQELGDTTVVGPRIDLSQYKVIELVRNRFDVCMSLLYSLATGVWHEEDGEDGEDGNDAFGQIEVNVTELVTCLEYKEQQREEGWLHDQLEIRREQGMVLTLEYERCQDMGLDECYSSAVAFLTKADATADAATHGEEELEAPSSDFTPTKLWQWTGLRKSSCADDPVFTDAHGKSCAMWTALDCGDTNGGACSYTPEEMADIRANCPAACNNCDNSTAQTEPATDTVLGLKVNAHSNINRGRLKRPPPPPSPSPSPLQPPAETANYGSYAVKRLPKLGLDKFKKLNDCIHQDFTFSNGDIGDAISGVSSAEACQEHCQSDPQCGVFVYAKAGVSANYCWLKCEPGHSCEDSVNGATNQVAMSQAQREDGVFSGPRSCASAKLPSPTYVATKARLASEVGRVVKLNAKLGDVLDDEQLAISRQVMAGDGVTDNGNVAAEQSPMEPWLLEPKEQVNQQPRAVQQQEQVRAVQQQEQVQQRRPSSRYHAVQQQQEGHTYDINGNDDMSPEHEAFMIETLKQDIIEYLCKTISPCPEVIDLVITKETPHGLADEAYRLRVIERHGVDPSKVAEAITKVEFLEIIEATTGEEVVYEEVANVEVEKSNEASLTAAGDPIFKYNGVLTKFVLPPAKLSPLLRWTTPNGDHLALLGATFSGPGHTFENASQVPAEDNEQQWFDHFVVRVNGAKTLEVTVSDDVRKLGSSSRSFSNAATMRVELDGKQQLASELAAYEWSSDNQAVQIKMNSHALRKKSPSKGPDDRHGERLHVIAGGLTFEIRSRAARKFASLVDQVKYTHLDLKVLDKLPASSTGFFAELGLVTPMSEETRLLIKRVSHSGRTAAKSPKKQALFTSRAAPLFDGADAFARSTFLRQTRERELPADSCCPGEQTHKSTVVLQATEQMCPRHGGVVTALADVDRLEADEHPVSALRGERSALLDPRSRLPNAYGPGCAKQGASASSGLLDDLAVDLMAQEERKNVSDPFDKVSNTRKVIVELARRGYASAYSGARMLYYFSWPEGSGGEEIASYLARLPTHFIVPGSNATGEFNFEAFARSSYQVERREHAVIAYGRGSSQPFFEGYKSQRISSRHVVSFGYMRDVQTQRLAFYDQFVAASGRPLLPWLTGCNGVPKLQMEQLKQLALNTAALEGETIQNNLTARFDKGVHHTWSGVNEHVAFVGMVRRARSSNPGASAGQRRTCLHSRSEPACGDAGL